MKIFDFLKSTRKCFSVKKFIKPSHTQEFYNNIHYHSAKDKKKITTSTATQAIFPMRRPLYPDNSKTLDEYDEQNEHYMYKLNRRVKELEERTSKHIQYAKASVEVKNSRRVLTSKRLKSEDLGEGEGLAIDKASGLFYGLGYDEYISSVGHEVKIETSSHEREKSIEQNKNMEELVKKLGYLDFRDFVALNKYIIEANNHEDSVNQTKSRFLNLAIDKMNQTKKEDVRKSFKKIDENNRELKSTERNDLKIEFLFDNLEESKELFYSYYYKLKELNSRDENLTLNEFEKYEKMVKSLNNSKLKKNDKDEYYHNSEIKNKTNSLTYDLEDYMERIIKTYRDQRTTEMHQDSAAILSKYKYLCEKYASKGMFDYNLIWERALTMAKYQTFLAKYKKMYVPTNMETERLINNYLREKRIKEFTKEKMMQEEDPYFSQLSDEDEMITSESIYDEETKKKAFERHQMKKKYFDAKYEFKLTELKKNIDKQLADELGIVLTQENQTQIPDDIEEFEQMILSDPNVKLPQHQFIEKFVNDHYRNFKLDFMYNYMDFFSNKYRVRRKIAEELKRKVSLKEINYILNTIVSNHTGINDLNKKTMRYSISDFVMSEYGKVTPNFIQTLTETSTGNPRKDEERKNAVLSAMSNVDKKSIELDQEDKFEIELYKGFKNDPYFKHYLYNNFAYFAETMNDLISGLPYINKGFKTDDRVKYEELKVVTMSKYSEIEKTNLISENKSEVLDSLQLNINNETTSVMTFKTLSKPSKSVRVVYYGRGKRKRSVALAELTPGNGTITVNGREFYHYFSFSPNRAKILLPFQKTDSICNWDVKLSIQGGGTTGQAEAAIPAISKALIQINPEWRRILAKDYLLKHDPRNVEPKKPGKIKARKGYVYNRR